MENWNTGYLVHRIKMNFNALFNFQVLVWIGQKKLQ